MVRATSVADIARDASVSGTLAYAYFPNKEALFLAAVDEDAAGVINEGLSTILDNPHAGPDDWRQALLVTLVAAGNQLFASGPFRTVIPLWVSVQLGGGVVECGTRRPLWLPYVEVAAGSLVVATYWASS